MHKFELHHHYDVDDWGKHDTIKFDSFDLVNGYLIGTAQNYHDIYLLSFFSEVIVGDDLENLLMMMGAILDSPLVKEMVFSEPIEIHLQHYDNFEDANAVSQDIREGTHDRAYALDDDENENNIMIDFSDN